MVTSASPAVAERIGLDTFHFFFRQIIFLSMALAVIIFTSFLSPTAVRRLATIGFLFGLILMVAVLFTGMEAKGARRWLYIGGLSLQPSEFIKPCFAVLTAWILAMRANKPGFPGFRISLAFYLIVVILLILQPDFGMTVTISLVWGGQVFIAGISLFWLMIAAFLAVLGAVGAYTFLPHVASRINSFLDPENIENYQVRKSLQAFSEGGLIGKGPGEGTVKQVLPDSHTDFILAVVGEELGMIACLFVIFLFAFIILRGLLRVLNEKDLFIVFAVSGLLMQIGIQALINMGVSLNLLPTKGMTLPLISYGGSSLLAIAFAFGMVLSLTRKRYGNLVRRW